MTHSNLRGDSLNTGGWLLLSVLFGALLFLVQRSESKRRLVTFVVLLLVALVVWRYALYRMSGECNLVLKAMCDANLVFRGRAEQIAINTTNVAILTAVILNILFWIFIGRSNPPRSSDVIQVFGMKD